MHAAAGDAAPGDYLLVVTNGLAQVRVEPGLVKPGQALIAGRTVGAAMVAAAELGLDRAFARVMQAQLDENDLIWALLGTQ